PGWHNVAGHGFHVLTADFVNTFAKADDITWVNELRWPVDLFAVHQDMAVDNHLAAGPNGAGEAGATNDVIEALLKELKEGLPGVAFAGAGVIDIATELAFQDVVVIAELLLFVLAYAVVLETATAIAMDAGRSELALGGMFGDIGDGDADATRKFDLGAKI